MLSDVPHPLLLDSKGLGLPIQHYSSPGDRAVPRDTSVCATGTAFQPGSLTQEQDQGYQAAKL